MDSNGREEKSYVQETWGFQFNLRLTWLYMMKGLDVCRAPISTDYSTCFWCLKNIADSTYLSKSIVRFEGRYSNVGYTRI